MGRLARGALFSVPRERWPRECGLSLDQILENLLSPMVLAFALGVAAKLLKSDLKLPNGLYTSISIYLLFAIGLKGGVALREASFIDVVFPAIATMMLGALTAFLAYNIALHVGRLSRMDAASLAAHYGSVSAVTFITAQSFAHSQNIPTEGFLPALVAVLEVPAILLALVLAGRQDGQRFGLLARELITGKTVVLLVGGMIIGFIVANDGYEQVRPVFGDLFKGALTFFLLEMGLVAASRLPDLGRHWLFLTLFGIAIPLINGALGVLAGTWSGMSPGGAGILGVMGASASYIAAPAAIRVALPGANVSLSLAAALAVTFPFNLAIGIPLFMYWAHVLAR